MTEQKKAQELIMNLQFIDQKQEIVTFFLDEFIQDSKDDGRLESMDYWKRVKESYNQIK